MRATDQGLRFGPFELHQPLGGSMGIVYRAHRTGSEAVVAVKVLRHERLLDGEARARFARELHSLRRLGHPGICPLLDAGEVDGVPWLCMPLLPGRTLAAHLDAARAAGLTGPLHLPTTDGAPPWRAVVACIADVAEALDAAHDLGLVHRDVKPGNLMVLPDGRPVLLDFGLVQDRADRFRELTRTGQLVGTPAYMAPEQLDPAFGPIGPRADVYGLAAVLYEALTLHPPFAGRTRSELFAGILTRSAPDPRRRVPDLPEALVQLLATALARRARYRPATAGAFATDLRQVLAGLPPKTRPPSPWRRLGDAARERPWAATLLVLLLAGVTTLAAILSGALQARATAATQRALGSQSAWLGRLELARAAHAGLPPAWPEHVPALQQWRAEHGAPLLLAAAQGEAAAPGLAEFARTAVADVDERLQWAATVVARSVTAFADRWQEAAAAVAADPRTAGWRLTPQPGLVPLGPDPRSGRAEFYDLASGDPELPPPRRRADGTLELADRHGIVFVLVPGGSHRQPGSDETVELQPFLLGKHELTRAQHRQLAQGRDPSRWPIGPLPMGRGTQTLRRPVDQFSIGEFEAVLHRWDLRLPTEVQWEYAAQLAGDAPAANCTGTSGARSGTAPVGSCPPDALGLHDLAGNLAELCADPFDAFPWPRRAGDGLRGTVPPLRPAGPPDLRVRVAHGGNFRHVPVGGAERHEVWADQRNDWLGARLVRALRR